MLERVRQKSSNFKSKISSLVEKHQLFSVSKNNIKRYLVAILILSVAIIAINSSLAATVPVKSIEIKSENLDYDKSEQGAWKVTKSAVWTDRNKARITFDVDTTEKNDNKDRDIIFIIDSSDNIKGQSSNVIRNIVNLIDRLKYDTRKNRVSYISYNDGKYTTGMSNLSLSLKAVKNRVQILISSTDSSYYLALLKLESALANYSYDKNKKVSVIFITAGAPTIDTPKEAEEYNKIKQQYPYAEIKAIQYNMGANVLDVVKNISDSQYIATQDNFDDILYETCFGVSSYAKFKITDRVNAEYFTIDKATATPGNLNINDNIVTWTAPDKFNTGKKAKISIDVTLKDTYQSQEGIELFKIANSSSVESAMDGIEENVQSESTPILSSKYTVTYDLNAPDGCGSASTPSPTSYFAFDTVSIDNSRPECFGYQFKGWQIVNKNVNQPTNDSFIMPNENVKINATWSKVNLIKSRAGKVSEQASLYNVIKEESILGGLAKEYMGNHQDSYDREATHKIYHYYARNNVEGTAIQNKNNVIFAGFCWQMIRTTDTGGVKILYNGEPDSAGRCTKDRKNHIGYSHSQYIDLRENYYYGTDFTYNPITNKFTISGEITQATWNEETAKSLLNKYTCISTNEDAECNLIYYIYGQYGDNLASTLPINSHTQYSGIGNASFAYFLEDSLQTLGNLLTNFGYMNAGLLKNTSTYDSRSGNSDTMLNSRTVSSNYYFGTDYTHILNYVIKSPVTLTDDYDYTKLVGMYTTLNVKRSSELYKVIAVNGNTIYYCNDTICNSLYTYGDSYTANDDGTYKLNNTSKIKRSDWYVNHELLRNKYICSSGTETACKELRYIYDTSNAIYYNVSTSDNYKYAKSYTYENNTYKLSDESVTFWDRTDENNIKKLNDHHYTCLNETGVCTDLYYVYHSDGVYFYTAKVTNQVPPISYFDNYLNTPELNLNNSIVKTAVDQWYKKHLANYSKYIEETIFCLDREIKDMGGWNPDGGDVTKGLTFKGKISDNDLSCKNKADKLSTSVTNSAANDFKPLPYSIGLLTRAEVDLLNNKNAISSGENYWLISPSVYETKYITKNIYGSSGTDYIYGKVIVKSDGSIGYTDENMTLDDENLIRPAISLKSNTRYTSGDGSMENPYIVDMSE